MRATPVDRGRRGFSDDYRWRPAEEPRRVGYRPSENSPFLSLASPGAHAPESPTVERPTASVFERGRTYRIGGAYWMPPLVHSRLMPRLMPSFDPGPTLRSNTSP